MVGAWLKTGALQLTHLHTVYSFRTRDKLAQISVWCLLQDDSAQPPQNISRLCNCQVLGLDLVRVCHDSVLTKYAHPHWSTGPPVHEVYGIAAGNKCLPAPLTPSERSEHPSKDDNDDPPALSCRPSPPLSPQQRLSSYSPPHSPCGPFRGRSWWCRQTRPAPSRPSARPIVATSI